MDEETKTESIALITTKDAIKRKSAYSLPDNPTESGFSADEIRKTLYTPIIDDKNSVITELERVIEEANTCLATKLNRIASDDGTMKAYVENDTKTELCRISSGDGTSEPEDSDIVKRNEGKINTAAPTENYNAVNLEFLQGFAVSQEQLKKLDLVYNHKTHALKIKFVDKNGNEETTSTGIDLALESAITDIEDKYDDNGNLEICFVFANGGKSKFYKIENVVDFKNYVKWDELETLSGALNSVLTIQNQYIGGSGYSASY